MKLDQFIENIAPLIQRNYHQKKKKESYDYKMLFILKVYFSDMSKSDCLQLLKVC